MSFVDEATIRVAAGAGGHGAMAFRHEPYKPKGGPDGGDGGDGGDVILTADRSVATLLELRDHPHVKASRGGHGQGKRRNGTRGDDRIVRVPVGTLVYDEDGVLIADLASQGDRVVVARGGRGGQGNARFATPTRRAPAFAEKGEPGDERTVRLELSLLADVALVGFPNAGKSTLISRISAARPKIADYPFTTLTPNLGVVRVGDESFVVADIPGLVPGAHDGKGLGHKFLRHIRRAALIAFVVDLAAQDRDPATDGEALSAELGAFDPELARRPSIVVANKTDVARDCLPAVLATSPEAVPVSAVTGEGLDELARRLAHEVSNARREIPASVGYIRHVVRDDPIVVEREDGAWRVRARRAEHIVDSTDMDNEEAVRRLQRRLMSMGVERALQRAGAQTGDEVRIADTTFDYEAEDEEVPRSR